MKVYELIEALKLCDIGKEVFIFKDANIIELGSIDELSDRVDINIKENKKEWTAEKFEPAVETEFDDLDDEVEYCVYCYEPIVEWKQSCCGENHFLTGFQIKEHERDLMYIDKRMKGANE